MTRDPTSDPTTGTACGTASGTATGTAPDAGEAAEMAETVAVLTSGLHAVGVRLEQHHVLGQRHVSGVEPAASRCADDPDFAAVWQRASRRARIEALTTVASLAAQVTPSTQTATEMVASIGGARLNGSLAGPVGALLECAVHERRVPLPSSGTGGFGPLTGPTVAAAAGLVRDGGIGERDQRVVFAVLAVHYLTREINRPIRGSSRAR